MTTIWRSRGGRNDPLPLSISRRPHIPSRKYRREGTGGSKMKMVELKHFRSEWERNVKMMDEAIQRSGIRRPVCIITTTNYLWRWTTSPTTAVTRCESSEEGCSRATNAAASGGGQKSQDGHPPRRDHPHERDYLLIPPTSPRRPHSLPSSAPTPSSATITTFSTFTTTTSVNILVLLYRIHVLLHFLPVRPLRRGHASSSSFSLASSPPTLLLLQSSSSSSSPGPRKSGKKKKKTVTWVDESVAGTQLRR